MDIQKLAEMYRRSVHDAALVAEICDEVIDRSGALLGEVRKAAEHVNAADVEHVHAKNCICVRCHPELEKLAPPRR